MVLKWQRKGNADCSHVRHFVYIDILGDRRDIWVFQQLNGTQAGYTENTAIVIINGINSIC